MPFAAPRRALGPRGPALRRTAALVLLTVAAVATAACTERSALDPQGPRAESVSRLWWFMLAIAGFVWVMVTLLMLIAVFHRRSREEPVRSDPIVLVLLAGAAFPVVVLIGVMAFTLGTVRSVTEEGDDDDLTVEVIGHRWWWEVRYPEEDFVTANEIHIPAGEMVRLELQSADVIHSLWVPKLAGKMDLIPGQTNTLWIEADEPGRYEGVCAEFCGIQHANMKFLIIAHEREEFDTWVESQQAVPDQPTSDLLVRGQQIFMGSACVYCHTVDGTTASGQIGPDLTHLGSRETIAAGTAPLNAGTLGGWIIDPQRMKPGNLMPPTLMEGEELQALIAYLMSLQ